jgi:hypothetical protein
MTDEIKQKRPRYGGRKKVVIDLDILEKLLIMQATDEEIGAWFGISKQAISKRKKHDSDFNRVYTNGRDRGKCSLRREMWKSAQGIEPVPLCDKLGQPVWDSKGHVVFTPGREPSVTMQIFLAKNILGMADKQEVTGRDGAPLISTIEIVRPCPPQ